MNRAPSLRYEPSILSRFPLVDYDCYPLPESVPLFCMPMGATVECWLKKSSQPKPLFSTFVLTSGAAVKVYGAAITFYEQFDEKLLNKDEKSRLNYITKEDHETKSLNAIKSICVLSRWPFFDTFEKFLLFLYRTACCSPDNPSPLPIERYISYFMLNVPFPSFQRPKILVQLGNSSDETALLSQPPEDMPLPLSGASFTQFLRNLGPENCITVLLLVLAEQKILLHSLRPDVLTSVAEALTSLIFPFHWQCPYIPLCPLGLCDVLNAPLPFIAGVDSRYFDLYELPLDVACVDLDTNSIYISEHKRLLNIKILPKKPTRVLKNTLDKLFERLVKPSQNGNLTYNPQSKSRNSTSPYTNESIAARKQERFNHLEIQEIFVKFMALILKDFRSFLRPITKAPSIGATDPNSLFDFQGFLRSRDKNHHRFYQILMRTQMFTRFIEERSFVSDKNTSLAFFDECLDKIEAYGDLDSALKLRLLDLDDSSQNDRTVYIPAPEPISSEKYAYKCFPELNPALFHEHPTSSRFDLDNVDSINLSRAGSTALLGSPLSRRTKQEIRSAQRVARKHAQTPLSWAKCLVSYCYSLWFIHLPSFVEATNSSMAKGKQLRIAYSVLKRMQSLNLHPTDEVCYRILMLLCGVYSQPILAVKVLTEMKRCGVTPNAITYGYYNKAVLESKWPSGDSSASLVWTRLRNVITGIAHFRNAGRIAKSRKEEDYSSLKEEQDKNFMSSNEEPQATSLLIKPLFSHKSSSNHSDAGYCSSVNNCENELTSSNLSISGATSSDKKSPLVELRSNTGGVGDFRIKNRTIVRNSLSSLSFEDYNSSAGVLMSSQVLAKNRSLGSPLLDNPFLTKRISKAAGNNETAGSLPRPVSVQPISEQSNRVKHSYHRSVSFGNDAKMMKNIEEGRSKALDDESIKEEGFSQTADECEKRLISDLKCEDIKTNNLAQVPEDDNVNCSGDGSEPHSSDSHSSDNSSAEDSDESDDSDSESSKENSSTNQDDSSFSFTPLKDHIMNMNIFSPEGKVASTLRSSLRIASRLAVGPTAINPVPRSSSFNTSPTHVFVPRKLSNKFNNLFKAKSEEAKPAKQPQKQITRSTTLPTESSRESISEEIPEKSISNESCSDEEDKTSQSSYGQSAWTAKIASGKHLELVNSTIKSATNTISNKFTGIKNTLASSSATSSPSKVPLKENKPTISSQSTSSATVSLLSQWSNLVTATIPAYFNSEEDDTASLTSLDYNKRMSIAASEEDASERSREGSLGRNVTGFSFLPQNPINMPPFFDIIEKHYKESLIPYNLTPIALKIHITSCNRCQSCSSILFDEDIMEVWSADDSNLNAQCCICSTKFVPLLTINLQLLDNESSLKHKSNKSTNSTAQEFTDPLRRESIVDDSLQTDCKVESTYESLHPFDVPYLSPIVLRKEFENVLESEGDACLTKSQFVEDHPILYWNLLWYFERINLPSHISGLCLHSISVMKIQEVSRILLFF